MIPGETILSGGAVDRHTSPFKVMRSGGGWYVGTTWGVCDDPICKQAECVDVREGRLPKNYSEPNTRETDYFDTREEAEAALASFHADEEHVLPGARTVGFNKPTPYTVISLGETQQEARIIAEYAELFESKLTDEERAARERDTYRPMPTSDPAHWMLEQGRADPSKRSKKTVHRDGCYICEDPEFSLMGLPLCWPCVKCDGHVAADDDTCDVCGFEHRDLSDEEMRAHREAAEEKPS